MVFTDQKPLLHYFEQRWERLPPRQTRQLVFISQFCVNIQHIRDSQTVVADALSRLETLRIPATIAYKFLFEEQAKCPILRNLIQSNSTSLTLRMIKVPGCDGEIICDTSSGQTRPYIPSSLRPLVFESLHGLSHPGIRASTKLIARNFVWNKMKAEVRKFVKNCQ